MYIYVILQASKNSTRRNFKQFLLTQHSRRLANSLIFDGESTRIRQLPGVNTLSVFAVTSSLLVSGWNLYFVVNHDDDCLVHVRCVFMYQRATDNLCDSAMCVSYVWPLRDLCVTFAWPLLRIRRQLWHIDALTAARTIIIASSPWPRFVDADVSRTCRAPWRLEDAASAAAGATGAGRCGQGGQTRRGDVSGHRALRLWTQRRRDGTHSASVRPGSSASFICVILCIRCVMRCAFVASLLIYLLTYFIYAAKNLIRVSWS